MAFVLVFALLAKRVYDGGQMLVLGIGVSLKETLSGMGNVFMGI